MARKLIERLFPNHVKVREHSSTRLFGGLLRDPNLWHLNKRSVAGGVATGLFMAFVPIPVQSVLAAGVAIVLRVNLPIAAILVWITNPITFTPIFFFAYKVGKTVLHDTPPPPGLPSEPQLEPTIADEQALQFEPSLEWFFNSLSGVWQPLLLGCLVLSTISAVLGYVAVRLTWRYHVIKRFQERRLARRLAKARKSQRSA
ncbi:MAG: DUF2062 domain-containing protein [Gammaproteobacteria bacterium]